METINMDSFGFKYSLILDSSFEYGFWSRMNTYYIEWENNCKTIKIAVELGTLTRELVSSDGQYLILIFQNSQQFPNPCNCVVYNLEGEVHRIVCAPYMVSEEVRKYHEGKDNIPGLIYGAAIKNIDGKEETTIFIKDLKEYFNTKVHYYEQRVFYPETGEMGGLVSVQIPLR